MSVLIFLLVLFALILVHEFGHFWAAKRTGMRVDEFGIGFPPKLIGIKKGETEYTFNIFPIGGFVRIWGEDGTDVPSSPVASEASDRRSERSEAGEGGEDITTDEKIKDENSERAFSRKPKWSQAFVLVAGVAANILFAWFLLSIVFAVGTPQVVDEAEAGANAKLVVLETLEGGPADSAGVQSGAVIEKLETKDAALASLTPTDFISFVGDHQTEGLTLTYTVGDEQFTSYITPVLGTIETEPDRPAIGIVLGMTEVVSYPIHEAVFEGLKRTVTMLGAITVAILTLLKDALTLNADLSQVAGPIGIVTITGEVSALGVVPLLLFTAIISLNLAVINILPFPALDGGRLLFVAIEAVKGSPIKPQLAYALNALGFVLLILLILVVSYNDILRIL